MSPSDDDPKEHLETKPNPRIDFRKKPSLLFPPPQHGMTVLDKDAFKKEVSVPSIVVDQRDIPTITKSLKPYFLKMPKFNPVQVDPSSPTHKRIHLNPELIPGGMNLSEFLSSSLDPSTLSLILSSEYGNMELSYGNWRWDQILDAIIPDEFEKMRSFTMIGSLLHLNLRDHLLPYKNVIGQVLLDGVPQARTILNKTNTIQNTYRNFQMELLGGDPNTVVKVKENGTEFEFDFAKVYWNSRLSSEHQRILDYLQPRDVLFDVFAGVGPFSVPAAKKKCFVVSNDLNPDSYHWLRHNLSKVKKVSPGWIQTFNLDGREFIRSQLPKFLIKASDESTGFEGFLPWTKRIHVTMNLPAIGVTFLDGFWGLVGDGVDPEVTLTVHAYCFIKGGVDEEEFKRMGLELVEEELRFTLDKERVHEVFYVRNVSPNKNMIRVTFDMPHQILNTPTPLSSSTHEPPQPKRLRRDDGDDREEED